MLFAGRDVGLQRLLSMDPQRARLVYELYGDDVERLAEEIAERRVEPLLEELRRVRNLNEELLEENERLRSNKRKRIFLGSSELRISPYASE